MITFVGQNIISTDKITKTKPRENREKIINKLIHNNMKKILLLAVALLGMAAGAEAQTLAVDGNEFVALKGKQATLAIKVNNATAVRDVMFDITLPTGITLGTVAPEDATNYKVAISDAKDGNTYTVILYSESGKTGATTINFPLTVPAEYTGELWANLSSSTANGKWTNDAATEDEASSTPYTFQVGLLGDASKDSKVNTTDSSALFDFISANATITSLGSFSVVVNINGDNAINTTDSSALFDIIAANGSSSVKGEANFEDSNIDDTESEWAD